MPESPRWLIAKNRHREAYAILKKIADSSGKKAIELGELENLNNVSSSPPLTLVRSNSFEIEKQIKVSEKPEQVVLSK